VIGVSPVVLADSLSKKFGQVDAVQDLSFALEAGTITGFLGPNGAGKTTTLRMLLGLAVPTSGRALVFDQRYAELERPSHRIGAVLEATDFHPGRSGRNHLRTLSQAAGIPDARVDEVLRLVELDGAANRRVKGYSLGMRQRLGLASALLGDPDLLILDEPANGLDPEGVRWLRDFLRGYAKGGRTVLVSSHVLAEVAQTVDHVLIVAKGRLVIESPLADLTSRVGGTVRVRSPQASELADALRRDGLDVSAGAGGALIVGGAPIERVGEIAAASSFVLHELASGGASLEEIFLELTSSGEDVAGAGGGGS
jgi:ABC-2 type transport system ATP-binding protein